MTYWRQNYNPETYAAEQLEKAQRLITKITLHRNATGFYALAPSFSEPGEQWRIDIDVERLITGPCQCKAQRLNNRDCYHRVATDIILQRARDPHEICKEATFYTIAQEEMLLLVQYFQHSYGIVKRIIVYGEGYDIETGEPIFDAADLAIAGVFNNELHSVQPYSGIWDEVKLIAYPY